MMSQKWEEEGGEEEDGEELEEVQEGDRAEPTSSPLPCELAALVSRLMLDWWVRERCGVHHQGQPIRRQGFSETKPGDQLTH